MVDEKQQKFRSVLKSSSLIGGSAFIKILIGMIRTKFVAVLLGPAGVGLMNIYSSIAAPILTISGMGISSSGVREIADAQGRNNFEHFAIVVNVLRKVVWITGLMGFLGMIIFSPWISFYTFGNSLHSLAISILAITILFENITNGYNCILQGTRKILDLAKLSVIGAILGTLISLPCFLFWGIEGIIPSLVLTSSASLVTSWWFVQKNEVPRLDVSFQVARAEAKKLLFFGLPLMGAALQGGIVAYLLRIIIMNQFGLDGVGVWTAAFSISGILVNFVLNAMGTDYYPRLTAVAHDNGLIEKEVNAQVKIALLLAIPALAVTILFAPLGIKLLYSGKFDAAIPILRWSVFGILGRVISWPLGFIILAQGRSRLFFLADLIANFVHLFLLYFCSKYWGLSGTGVAFMLNYIIHVVAMIFVACYIAETKFDKDSSKLIILSIMILAFSSFFHQIVNDLYLYYLISGIVVFLVAVFSLNRLSGLTGLNLRLFSNRFFSSKR